MGPVVLVGVCQHVPTECWRLAEERVHQETAALGFEVQVVDGQEADESARLEELAKLGHASGAFAAVRVAYIGREVQADMWLPDPSNDAHLHRQLVISNVSGPHGATVVALRLAEMLKASLVKFRARPRSMTPIKMVTTVIPFDPFDAQSQGELERTALLPTEPGVARWSISAALGGLGLPGQTPVAICAGPQYFRAIQPDRAVGA